jgi:hypothetical protein
MDRQSRIHLRARTPAPPACPMQVDMPKSPPMDTEEINAIGTLLADLSDRTQQLRGYL